MPHRRLLCLLPACCNVRCLTSRLLLLLLLWLTFDNRCRVSLRVRGVCTASCLVRHLLSTAVAALLSVAGGAVCVLCIPLVPCHTNDNVATIRSHPASLVLCRRRNSTGEERQSTASVSLCTAMHVAGLRTSSCAHHSFCVDLERSRDECLRPFVTVTDGRQCGQRD